MEKLSDITKDYLTDFEVLTEARREFEQQMENWWKEIFRKQVQPALQQEQGGQPYIWENQNRPGMCHCWEDKSSPVYLALVDPRASDRRFYTVSVCVGSQPDLRKITKQDVWVSRMNKVAEQQRVAGVSGLNWKDRQLASLDIEILADDPEETTRQVSDAALRFYRVVLEYGRARNEAK